MKNKFYYGILFGTAFTSSTCLAVIQPQRLSSDSRIEVVAYSPYNVVNIFGSTFTTTQIIFSQEEYIENVQNGDLAAWTASIDKDLPYTLFIKPTAYGSNTNMTVITNKHTYYFHLVSNQQDTISLKQTTYAIQFIYPEELQKKTEAAILSKEKQRQAELSAFKNPSHFNWDYSFSGDKAIVPIHVFDDGKFTYLQLQDRQAVPAIFAVNSSSGNEAVVNYRQDGNYLVIQRLAPQFTLRLGQQQVACLFNNKLINKLQDNPFYS